ncbi:hypothetical protein BaRGS_00019382 [Batillaria attramentaria]|uniref:Uncharacterized protein n=1 Tax=Batillaria attramentaria TaxID=370345 RepID=A0ABD0KRG5_9CAEN
MTVGGPFREQRPSLEHGQFTNFPAVKCPFFSLLKTPHMSTHVSGVAQLPETKAARVKLYSLLTTPFLTDPFVPQYSLTMSSADLRSVFSVIHRENVDTIA